MFAFGKINTNSYQILHFDCQAAVPRIALQQTIPKRRPGAVEKPCEGLLLHAAMQVVLFSVCCRGTKAAGLGDDLRSGVGVKTKLVKQGALSATSICASELFCSSMRTSFFRLELLN